MQQRVPRQWPGRQFFKRQTAEISDLQNKRAAASRVVHSLEQAAQYLAFDRRVALGGWCDSIQVTQMMPITMHARLHVEPVSQFAMARLTFNCGGDFMASVTTTSSYPGAAAVVDYVEGGNTAGMGKGAVCDTSPWIIGATPPVPASPYTVDVEIVVAWMMGAGWDIYCTGVQFFALPLSGTWNQEGGTVNAG